MVIGSQAVLATAPDWALPPIAMVSVEADFIAFDDAENAKADLVDGVLGEGSMFHETHGVYARAVGVETIIAPSDWRDRLIPYRNENTTAWPAGAWRSRPLGRQGGGCMREGLAFGTSCSEAAEPRLEPSASANDAFAGRWWTVSRRCGPLNPDEQP